MEGIEKRNQYAILMSKLKKAVYNEFYYEAVFIEYAILEDRTESVLKHAGVTYQKNNGYSLEISKKLNKIKSNKIFQDKYIKKHITDELIDNITEWKNNRDKLIHALVKNNYDYDELKRIALTGECLVYRFTNKSKLVNNYLDKKEIS